LLTCTSHLSKYGIGLKIGSNSAIGDFAHLEQLEESILAMMLLWVHISFIQNHSFNDTTKLIREQELVQRIKLGNNICRANSFLMVQ
jgi:hypothetical protein